MSEVARLVGMEQRSYEKDGRQREYCGLHFLFDIVAAIVGWILGKVFLDD